MISHIFIGVDEFDRALAFYVPVLTHLGWIQKFVDEARPWAGWKTPDSERPLFVIGRPYNGQAASPGNGQMVALLASSRAAVDEFYRIALEHGGTCDGPPGLRPEYHAAYYGAYVRDPEGNKLCVCCHD